MVGSHLLLLVLRQTLDEMVLLACVPRLVLAAKVEQETTENEEGSGAGSQVEGVTDDVAGSVGADERPCSWASDGRRRSAVGLGLESSQTRLTDESSSVSAHGNGCNGSGTRGIAGNVGGRPRSHNGPEREASAGNQERRAILSVQVGGSNEDAVACKI